MAEFLENAVVQQATFFILNTDWTRREFHHFYQNIAPEKSQLIPSGYEPKVYEDIKQPFSSGTDSFKLVYFGSIYGGSDPVSLL